MSDHQILVIGGPSGSGKSTLIRGLLGQKGTRLSVSVTTRPPRPHEQEGRDYRFVDRARFQELRRQNKLLEWAQVFGEFYGTPRDELLPRDEGEHLVILDLDLQGLLNVKAQGIPHISIFVAPPSLEELERRLRQRGTDAGQNLQERIREAARDMAASNQYDHLVVNRQVEDCLAKLLGILGFKAAGSSSITPTSDS